MAGFCPHDWHQTTEADLQQASMGEDFWLFGGEALCYKDRRLRDLSVRQKIVTDEAHRLAEQRGLIPYTSETFEGLMREVETSLSSTEQGEG